MHVFFRSRQIRDLTKNKFFNCACVGFNSKVDPVEFLYSGLMSVMKSEQGEHESESWAELGRPFLSGGEIVQRTWSAARNLESILEESNSPRIIDLLSIDVEGNEFDVLNGINFSNRIFNYILIETQKDSKAYKLLLANKYRHLETIAQNLLFVHTSYVDY